MRCTCAVKFSSLMGLLGFLMQAGGKCEESTGNFATAAFEYFEFFVAGDFEQFAMELVEVFICHHEVPDGCGLRTFVWPRYLWTELAEMPQDAINTNLAERSRWIVHVRVEFLFEYLSQTYGLPCLQPRHA
jgi:hypothetical protein